MDTLNFDPANTTNTDTTKEVEGYDNHIEEIQNAYPEQDWRTPAQIEEENQAQQQQQAGEEQADPVTEIADQVTDQVSEQLGIE